MYDSHKTLATTEEDNSPRPSIDKQTAQAMGMAILGGLKATKHSGFVMDDELLAIVQKHQIPFHNQHHFFGKGSDPVFTWFQPVWKDEPDIFTLILGNLYKDARFVEKETGYLNDAGVDIAKYLYADYERPKPGSALRDAEKKSTTWTFLSRALDAIVTTVTEVVPETLGLRRS